MTTSTRCFTQQEFEQHNIYAQNNMHYIEFCAYITCPTLCPENNGATSRKHLKGEK